MNVYLAEAIGTMILLILGDGVVANVLLNKSKGQGGGWMVITTAWGLAVTIAFTRSNSPALMASNNPAGSMTSVMPRFYPLHVAHVGSRAICALARSPSSSCTPAWSRRR